MFYYAQQFAVTKLSVSGSINDSQTTGIILQSTTGIDKAKPGILCLSWSDPLDTTLAEYVSYTSIDVSNELQGVTRGAEGSTAKTHLNGVDVAWILTESHINNINDMFTTGGAGYTQISTPASPSSGYDKLYFKSDDKLYKLNSAGTETEVGAGGFKVVLTPLSATFPASNYPQLLKNIGTNAIDFTLDYDASTKEYAYWQIPLPTGLTISSATLYVTYRSTAGSGNIVWSCLTKSTADGETWDASATDDNFTASGAGSSGQTKVTSKALTITGWSAGENLLLGIYRKADDAGDTAGADAKLMQAILIIS